jgi:phosphoribosylaminoimidazole-succinocarboxamide synthase
VRNFAAGSIVRRYGLQEGLELNPPTFEFFLKNDALGDPICNESHILSFKWATQAQIDRMKELTLKINDVLKPLFLAGNMLLVDYKLEFGLFKGELVLGDEFSPDGCRLWDKDTREKLDKDRFRQDLGNVVESYELVGKRLGVKFD